MTNISTGCLLLMNDVKCQHLLAFFCCDIWAKFCYNKTLCLVTMPTVMTDLLDQKPVELASKPTDKTKKHRPSAGSLFLYAKKAQNAKVLVLFLVAVAITALMAGVLGYAMGERKARMQSAVIGVDGRGKKITLEEFQTVSLENDILKSEMATLTQERDIALNNFNLIKDEVQSSKTALDDMKSLNQALTESAKFSDEPLQVVGMNIQRIQGETFEYRFDVLIPSIEIKTMIPSLTLLNATSMVEIPINPTHYEDKGLVTIKGKFLMPDNFTPSQLKLVVVVEDEKVVKFYDWNAR